MAHRASINPIRDAAWGFVNHWYPALSSHELVEDQVEGVQICGIPIVLRRANGKVFALKDQCLHRGVRLSEKPMRFNKKTLSCWYYGFSDPTPFASLLFVMPKRSACMYQACQMGSCRSTPAASMRSAHPVLSKVTACHEWQPARKTGFGMLVQPISSSL